LYQNFENSYWRARHKQVALLPVLPHSHQSQIRAAIIQAVPVDMINFNPLKRIKYYSMLRIVFPA
jgi:hypothetical protein